MSDRHESLLGIGVYRIPEAARLTGVPARTIHRWIGGYDYRVQGNKRSTPPLWAGQIEPLDGLEVLSFRDLLEVRFVQFFRKEGVSWRTIKRAAACAAEMVHDSHPFSTRKFKTNGHDIFADFLREGAAEKSLLNLAARQYEFPSFVEPHLYRGVEFSDLGDGNTPIRWWPLGVDRHVVIDPERSFGQPICTPGSVPTAVLDQAVKAEGSMEAVADWFMLDPQEVEDAVAYEDKLRTAA